MSIPVLYGSTEDKAPAEQVAKAINERSDFSSYSTLSSGVEWSSFDGVVLVGAQKASEAWDEVNSKTSLKNPTQSNYKVIQSVELEGTPILGIAGYTDENTESAVNEALSDGSLNQFLGISGDDREDSYDPGEDDSPNYGDGEPNGEKITLEYTGAFGVADTVLGLSAGGIEDILNNKNITDRTGYTINDIEVDKQNNEVDIWVTEVGSVSLLTAGLIIAGLLSAVTIAISWAVKNVKETETDQKIIEEKSDTQEALKSIVNSPEADAESKEQARKALIEMGYEVGDDTSTGGGSGGSGNGLLGGLPISTRDLLIIAGGILLLDEFTGGRSTVRTIVQKRR